MAEYGTNSKPRRSALTVIILLLAIGVVVWVPLALMGCAASEEPAGEVAAETVDAWRAVAGTLYAENPETGELEKASDVTVELDDRGLVASIAETSYASGEASAITTTSYVYDDAGHVTTREVAYEDGGSSAPTSAITSDYVYDDAGWLSVITTPESESTGRELFDYDEHGHLITIMQTYDLEATTRTYLTHLDYDAQDLPVSATSDQGDSATSATWAYDGSGRLTAFSDLPLGEGVTNLMDYALSYDDADRVASVACAPGDFVVEARSDATKVGYDATVTYAYDDAGRCTEARATGSYTYGDEFLTSATCSYDENGNLARVDFTDTNIFDGRESRQRYALELEYERVTLPADAASQAIPALSLAPSYDKRLFGVYAAEPSMPVAPQFAPDFARATYLGYREVLTY